jgi:hypothetical protein
MDNLCNEAFDELLTQEFNLDGNDFEDDSHSEVDHPKEASHSKANLSKRLVSVYSYNYFFSLSVFDLL